MLRAGLFIGVDRTGDLPVLRDAAAGAGRMHQWALQQGLRPETRARLLTDADGAEVTPDQIFDAVETITRGGVDQLIVYFAGHGVIINRGEQWLLTHAPSNSNAAVNVAGSVELARYGRIQHVVFISDACRVAAEGIRAQNVRGCDIFPNPATFDQSKPVDQFYACGLGKTAAEIKNPNKAATTYQALYTGALLDALTGTRAEVLEPDDADGRPCHLVRPRTLQSYLHSEVPVRVRGLGLERVNQNPDAIITSDRTWLARIEHAAVATPEALDVPPSDGAPPAPSVAQVAKDLVSNVSAVAGKPQRQLDLARDVTPGSEAVIDTAHRNAALFGPSAFETRCGFKVRGAKLTGAFARRADLDPITGDGEVLRVLDVENPAASVLLSFEGGFGAAVPAVPDFIAALTFDGRELVDISYEPSRNSARWDEYAQSADNVRALRAIAAASAEHGRFALHTADANSVAEAMQYAKGVDPTLAIYAAYAYHDLQQRNRIEQMKAYQSSDLHVAFFDVALLAGELLGTSIDFRTPVVPFFPLMSQGWALLHAHQIRLPSSLQGIENTMLDSLWSLFDSRGVDMLRHAIQSGAAR